jgi:hypothetical protein
VIRQGNWKLHEYFEDSDVELYDLRLDLAESQNLATIYPAKADSLLQELRNWRKVMEAPVPIQPNPNFIAVGTE